MYNDVVVTGLLNDIEINIKLDNISQLDTSMKNDLLANKDSYTMMQFDVHIDYLTTIDSFTVSVNAVAPESLISGAKRILYKQTISVPIDTLMKAFIDREKSVKTKTTCFKQQWFLDTPGFKTILSGIMTNLSSA
jgi:hypothetical protein